MSGRCQRKHRRLLSSLQSWFTVFTSALVVASTAHGQDQAHPVRVAVARVEQVGTVPVPVRDSKAPVIALEADGSDAGITLEFDLNVVKQDRTPLAQLQIELKSVQAAGLAERDDKMRGAINVWVRSPSNGEKLSIAGSRVIQQRRGVAVGYIVDVTQTINAALARPASQRTVGLELRLSGKPGFAQVYAMTNDIASAPSGPLVIPEIIGTSAFSAAKPAGGPPALVLAPDEGWPDDFQQRMTPLSEGPLVYRESCLPIPKTRDEELTMKLLFPARHIVEVIRSSTGEPLQEGRDWVLRDGKLVLPAGSKAPLMLHDEFFAAAPKKPTTAPQATPSIAAAAPELAAPTTSKKLSLRSIRVEDGSWYRQRQIEVTYEPASRDWSFPPPISSLDQLPRLKGLLAKKAPVTVVGFGASIMMGGNVSGFTGSWPYQLNWPELACQSLERHFGSKVTYLSRSYGGTTAKWGVDHAESLVGCTDPKPDLVIIGFGMNDRHYVMEEKDAYHQNLERIIDITRAKTPEAEFLIVAQMLNNPKQPVGLEPAFAVRAEALKVNRPGVAFVDVMAAHEELLKHKDYLDISGNGVNHTNDFLARIHAQRICEVLIPSH